MKKVPTIFERDWDGDRSRVVDVRNPECKWVFEGLGYATRKLDGMCCAIIDGEFFKRREVKKGKPDPDGFVLIEEDETTGKRVGWVPVGDGPEDRYFREAYSNLEQKAEGTYELVGPKSQGGIEQYADHKLISHDDQILMFFQKETDFDGPPRDFAELRDWLANNAHIEGIVWHHPDGRWAKIKGKDFGISRVLP